MITKTKKSIFGILAAVFILISNLNSISRISFWGIWDYVYLLADMFLVVCLFARWRNNIMLAALGVQVMKKVYNIISIISMSTIFSLLCHLMIFLIAVVLLADKLWQFRKLAQKLWFLPGLLMTCLVIGNLYNQICLGYWEYWRNVALPIFNIIKTFLLCHWLVYPIKTYQVSENEDINKGEAYVSTVNHVLLLLFTFGIWQLIWIYRTTRVLNCVKGEEERNPTTKLLLYIFIPFYDIYWAYKSAQRVDVWAKEKGVNSEIATLCLVLSFFIPIIPPILIQDKINNIVTAKGEIHQTVPVSSNADELKKYKDLLDSGIITQEEFDAKKKELLGL